MHTPQRQNHWWHGVLVVPHLDGLFPQRPQVLLHVLEPRLLTLQQRIEVLGLGTTTPAEAPRQIHNVQHAGAIA
jgi:hypothetical protein